SPARDAGIVLGFEKKLAFASSIAPTIMIAITPSGNNNLCHLKSYSYVRSWRKPGPENNCFPLETLATQARSPAVPQSRKPPGRRPFTFNDSVQDPFRFVPDRRKDALLLFHHALQRVLMLAREIHHLRHLGLGDLVGEHAALPDSVMMDVEHDLGRGFDV